MDFVSQSVFVNANIQKITINVQQKHSVLCGKQKYFKEAPDFLFTAKCGVF